MLILNSIGEQNTSRNDTGSSKKSERKFYINIIYSLYFSQPWAGVLPLVMIITQKCEYVNSVYS